MARPITKTPETQIYFIIHRSGANSVPRVRTVARGERASRSIVNRTTAFWSIWVVASLILADLGSGLFMCKRGAAKTHPRMSPRGGAFREALTLRGTTPQRRRGARRRRGGVEQKTTYPRPSPRTASRRSPRATRTSCSRRNWYRPRSTRSRH